MHLKCEGKLTKFNNNFELLLIIINLASAEPLSSFEILSHFLAVTLCHEVIVTLTS